MCWTHWYMDVQTNRRALTITVLFGRVCKQQTCSEWVPDYLHILFFVFFSIFEPDLSRLKIQNMNILAQAFSSAQLPWQLAWLSQLCSMMAVATKRSRPSLTPVHSTYVLHLWYLLLNFTSRYTPNWHTWLQFLFILKVFMAYQTQYMKFIGECTLDR